VKGPFVMERVGRGRLVREGFERLFHVLDLVVLMEFVAALLSWQRTLSRFRATLSPLRLSNLEWGQRQPRARTGFGVLLQGLERRAWR